MPPYVDLTNDSEEVITSKDSIVIVDNFQSIRGGRSLNVTGFTPEVINAGHVIIKETATGDYKPMPVTVNGTIEGNRITAGGSSYVNGSYSAVALTGGSGSGATANITVAGGAVTAVTIVNKGTGYKDGDDLSASNANLGGAGSGFVLTVTAIDTTATGYDALPAGHTYAGILVASIRTKKAYAGIMVRGTVNDAAAPFSMTSILSAVKTALPLIDFRQD